MLNDSKFSAIHIFKKRSAAVHFQFSTRRLAGLYLRVGTRGDGADCGPVGHVGEPSVRQDRPQTAAWPVWMDWREFLAGFPSAAWIPGPGAVDSGHWTGLSSLGLVPLVLRSDWSRRLLAEQSVRTPDRFSAACRPRLRARKNRIDRRICQLCPQRSTSSTSCIQGCRRSRSRAQWLLTSKPNFLRFFVTYILGIKYRRK